MRRHLLAGALCLVLAGCTSGTSGGEPTAERSATAPTPSATTPVQGPRPGPAVPTGAFVAPADLGPGWVTARAAPLPCAPRLAPDSIGSAGMRDDRGTLTETIATGVEVRDAVAAWRRSLGGCRYDVQDDPLGDAGIRARSADGASTVVVTGTEGVLVVLHAQAGLAEAIEELAGWADLALGTSCVAAPDGCH